ncbi:MAG: hypothetical protein DRI71_11190 [Bacteroidetes bacterium]|nr:MAG: hypothetical protein DRI71_11190 [Bacteroidota bacterium]
MITAGHCNNIFSDCIEQYHVLDSVDQPFENLIQANEIDQLLYHKCWIDTVQWHYEDLIRDPEIDPKEGMALKRLIDASNQRRTDMVEQIDDWFLAQFDGVSPADNATVNTESPAWVVDRLSILALKIYHMQEQTGRDNVEAAHIQQVNAKLEVLLEQQKDLSTSFDQLLEDIGSGKRKMKVYRQMKLYNDPATNPVLYKNK